MFDFDFFILLLVVTLMKTNKLLLNMLSTKDKEELYGFDPSSRINIDLVNGESSTSQAQK